jgi:predicted alpha/beta-hydrolase family hydrolase
MRPILPGALVLLLSAGAALPEEAADVEEVVIPTARGAKLFATLHRPRRPNGSALLLAPGQGYDRTKPLLARSAERLAAAGFVALRFDWADTPEKGRPSPDLSAETADLDAAARFLARAAGCERILLGGKSLGSLVAARWAVENPAAVAGLALLTLPVNDPQDPSRPFDSRETLLRLPLEPLIVCGDSDPLADRNALYRLAARMEAPPRVVVLPGDHGFAGPSKDAAETAENVDAVAGVLLLWARRSR